MERTIGTRVEYCLKNRLGRRGYSKGQDRVREKGVHIERSACQTWHVEGSHCVEEPKCTSLD